MNTLANSKLTNQMRREELIGTLKGRMVTREGDIVCSGGELTNAYLDIPGALRDRRTLKLAIEVFLNHIITTVPNWIDTTMFGGPTTGSIPLVMGAAMDTSLEAYLPELEWFIVRDKVKDHGLGRRFVGGEPGPGDKVILTDDVVSSGASLRETYERIIETGAQVIAVVPMVDRGNRGSAFFKSFGIPYLPVLTHADLGLSPLGT